MLNGQVYEVYYLYHAIILAECIFILFSVVKYELKSALLSWKELYPINVQKHVLGVQKHMSGEYCNIFYKEIQHNTKWFAYRFDWFAVKMFKQIFRLREWATLNHFDGVYAFTLLLCKRKEDIASIRNSN